MANENIPLPAADEGPGAAPRLDSNTSLPDGAFPTHKLDADNYLADDLDGVTESLFGSGNLNYLLLQARQSDAAGVAGGFENVAPADSESLGALAALISAAQDEATATAFGNNTAIDFADGNNGISNTLAQSGPDGIFSPKSNFDNLQALSTNADMLTPPSPNPPPEDPTASDNPDDPDTPDDPDPPDDPDGPDDPDDPDDPSDPDDPTMGGDPDDIDVSVTNDVNLPEVDINLDPLEDIVGDIDVGVDITHGDDGIGLDVDTVLLDIPVAAIDLDLDVPILNPVLDSVLDVTDPVLGAVTDVVQPVIDGLSDTVESVIDSLLGQTPPDGDVDLSVHQDLGLPQIDVNLDVVENIVGDIDVVVDIDRTDDGINLGVDTIVADIPLVNADITPDIPVVMPAVNGAVDPLAAFLADTTSADTLENLTDQPLETVGAIVADAVETLQDSIEGAVGGLQESLTDTLETLGQQDTSADDVDIAVNTPLGLPPIEISLDPLEQITGDIDLDLSLTNENGGLGLGLDSVLAGLPLTEGQQAFVDVPILSPTLEALADDSLTPQEQVEEAVSATVESLDDTIGDIGDVVSDVSEQAEDITQTLTGGIEESLTEIGDVVEDGVVGGALAGDLQPVLENIGQADTSTGDTDISLGNNIAIPQVDILLDNVESITGDIDLGVDVGLQDDSLNIGLDVDLIGIPVADGTLEVEIPLIVPAVNDLTEVTQEILGTALGDDTTADGAMGLLDDALQGVEDITSQLLGNGTSGGDDPTWPQLDTGGLTADVAEVLGGLAQNPLDTVLDLPEPIGNLTEGLGLITGGGDTGGSGGGLLSGLSFGHHGGGLFG